MKTFIAAASGNIGSKVASSLLAAGHNTVLMTRRPAKSQPGVTIASFDSTDKHALAAATVGVDALFWLTPPAFGATDVRDFIFRSIEAAAHAVATNRISHVVNLSAVRHNATPNTVLDWYRQAESALHAAAPNLVTLEPAWFMENLLHQPPGALFTLFPEDFSFPWVATRDIAAAAVASLTSPTWQGHHTRQLLGPANHTITEVATLLNRPHTRITPDQQLSTLLSIGATPTAARTYTDLFVDLARPDGPLSVPRTPAATTTTTLVDFSRENGLLC